MGAMGDGKEELELELGLDWTLGWLSSLEWEFRYRQGRQVVRSSLVRSQEVAGGRQAWTGLG